MWMLRWIFSIKIMCKDMNDSMRQEIHVAQMDYEDIFTHEFC